MASNGLFFFALTLWHTVCPVYRFREHDICIIQKNYIRRNMLSDIRVTGHDKVDILYIVTSLLIFNTLVSMKHKIKMEILVTWLN